MADSSPLARYLTDAATSGRVPDAGFIAYLASLDQVSRTAPEVAVAVVAELADQRSSLKMIARENYSSLAVQLATVVLRSVAAESPSSKKPPPTPWA